MYFFVFYLLEKIIENVNLNSRMSKAPKRKGRRKKKDRPELEFIESPIDKYSSVDHPDFGEPIEFPTSIVNGQTQWITPHITEVNVTPKPKRSGMKRLTKKEKSAKVVLKKQDDNLMHDLSTQIEYNEIEEDETIVLGGNRRFTRSMAKTFCRSPEKENVTLIDDIDSPNLPSNLSTPELENTLTSRCTELKNNFSSEKTPGKSPHYLFRGQTPKSKSFIVLAKDTPL